MEIYISNAAGKADLSADYRSDRAAILSGKLREGEALPSIRLLARELQISVITTKRAYEDLERAGLIETQPGRGSFVAAKNGELLREAALKRVEDALNRRLTQRAAAASARMKCAGCLNCFWKGEGVWTT